MTNNELEMDLRFEMIGGGFTLKEATDLMHHEVVRTKDIKKPRTIEYIGIISGILHVNDEIELVIQFSGRIEQFTKHEFDSTLVVTTRNE